VFVIAHAPGIASGQRGSGFRSVDVATTVLDFLGIEPDPAWQLEGRSLLRP
jgi:arylsulfatase A-like enzyme